MRILAAAVGSTVLVSLLAACGHQPPSATGTSKPEQAADHIADAANRVIAAPVNPDPRVGAIFLGGSDLHTCTGSVLHSAAGNLVLTAAHCLGGGGPATFVPGFAGKATPDEVWTLGALYLDPRWVANKDPRADYAIARVGRADGGSVEAQVGSALSLGSAPAKGSRVNVVAYRVGVGGMPIGCQASTGISDGGYPELPCAGLVEGTSGAPWISGSTVTGVIGGPQGGGCAENLSFSSPFDQHITDLLARAEAGGPGDVPPAAFDDEC
ncbi:MAG TPA: serine protease [Mycobacterium sp.]|uniref:trypsin-like serine peptidase n=1 Tax=Mycobacterium sp. TaxID=1785 RepID=UPI002D49E37C|nr:serine protease [Mycobacterium sp.]HXY65586.1 serine protease [Mycobacterium sp.]